MDGPAIADAFYRKINEHVYACRICGQKKRSKGGYSNLKSHLNLIHEGWEVKGERMIEEAKNSQITDFLTAKPRTIYLCLKLMCAKSLPLNLFSDPIFREMHKDGPDPRTLKKYMNLVHQEIVKDLKQILPPKFGIVFDGWSNKYVHFLAIFAVIPQSEENSNGPKYYCLSFLPINEDGSMTANSHVLHIESTLHKFGRTLNDILFIVGDNCPTNKRVAKNLRKPLVGCASHRLNLACKDFFDDYETIVLKIDAIMKKLQSSSVSAVLKKHTPLKPIRMNVTRWLSKFSMIQRYKVLKPFIRQGSIRLHLGSLMLTTQEEECLESLTEALDDLEIATRALQNVHTDLSEARDLFDDLISLYPELESRLGRDAIVVHSPVFENAVVSAIKKRPLEENELDELEPYKATAVEVVVVQPGMNPTRARIRSRVGPRRGQDNAEYMNLCHIPATSNHVERFFSTAKLTFTDLRAKLSKRVLESQLFLKFNGDMWNANMVDRITRNSRIQPIQEAENVAIAENEEESESDGEEQAEVRPINIQFDPEDYDEEFQEYDE